MTNPIQFIKKQISKKVTLDNGNFVKLFLNFYPLI